MTLNDKDREFLSIYNDLITYPNSAAVAAKLDMSHSRVRSRAHELRRAAEVSGDGTFFVASRQHPSVPMSEHSERFKADWTAEDCIVELQRIAAIDLDRGSRQ